LRKGSPLFKKAAKEGLQARARSRAEEIGQLLDLVPCSRSRDPLIVLTINLNLPARRYLALF
jgi:hypothetical protein